MEAEFFFFLPKKKQKRKAGHGIILLGRGISSRTGSQCSMGGSGAGKLPKKANFQGEAWEKKKSILHVTFTDYKVQEELGKRKLFSLGFKKHFATRLKKFRFFNTWAIFFFFYFFFSLSLSNFSFQDKGKQKKKKTFLMAKKFVERRGKFNKIT